MQIDKTCVLFYSKKEGLTGQLVDDLNATVVKYEYSSMILSYVYKRVSENIIENIIQMNIKEESMARRKDSDHHTVNVPNDRLIELTLHYDKYYRMVVFKSG